MTTGPKEPEMIDDTTMRLYGVGPACPDCNGPTHAVTGDENAEMPWWCAACNLRVASDENGGVGGLE